MVLNKIMMNIPAGAAKVITIAAVLLASILFLTPYANSASAWGYMQTAQGNSLQGEIVAVDNADHITTLTIRSDEIGSFPNDELNVFLNRDTLVKMCGRSEPAKDLKTGLNAKIEYHESGGVPVADVISERC